MHQIQRRSHSVHAHHAENSPVESPDTDSQTILEQTFHQSVLAQKTFFFFYRWLHRISRILAVLGYEGIKKATPVVLHPKGKSSAHSL